MAVKFLDYTGLGYFWSKIKAWCNATFAAITHSHAWSTITGKPTTVSGYGITDAKIDNETITLGSNTITPLTSHQTLPTLSRTISGSGNAITDITVSGHAITATKGATFLTSHQSLDGKMTRGSYERIEGTSSAHKDLNSYTTAGFYNVKTANVDNCPSGIGIDAVLLVYPWNTGTFCTQELTESAASSDVRRWVRKYDQSIWTNWKQLAFQSSIPSIPSLSLTTSGSGNAITALSVSNHAITATKGTTFLTSHQSLANYVTLNSAQTISAVKTFTANPVLNQVGLDMTVKDTDSTTTRTAQVLHANSDNAGYGINLGVGGSGNTVLGAGESCTVQLNELAGNVSENLYLVADGNIYFKPNGNTWSNAKRLTITTNGGIEFNALEATRGTAPASIIERCLADVKDSASNRIGLINTNYYTNKSSLTSIWAYNTTTATGNNIGNLGIGCDASGNVYTVAPTPVTSDNSTKIATTAFVKAQGYITSSGNVATATKLANARTISLSGAVTGSVGFDGSGNSEISTVWRSCIVGHGDNNPNGQNWFKVATFTADASYLDYSITFYVEDTYYNAHQGILKIHLRTDWYKILGTNREHDTYLTWLTHTDYTLSDFVLVCPTTASPTLELWTRISGQYTGRRFVVLSEGNIARAVTQWDLVGSINVRESSITSTGTQVESSENTYYVNNRKQQDIAGFKTFWNDLTLRGANILKYDNTSYLLLSSGHGFSRENGAHINLYGAEYSSGAGSFVLYTGHATQTTCPALFGWPSGSLQWNGQSIQTSSDERLKTSLTTVADEILDIWEDIQWGQFQFLDAVEEKGQNARLHLGFIAQHVKSVFEAHNIDICKFGILCHEIREATEFEPAFEQWMARYTEALCMEVIYQRRKNKILENRISELETQVQNMLQILESLKGA